MLQKLGGGSKHCSMFKFKHKIFKSYLNWFVRFVSPPKCYFDSVIKKPDLDAPTRRSFPHQISMPKCFSMAPPTSRLSVGLLASDCYEKTTGQTCQMQCIRGYDLIGAVGGGVSYSPSPFDLEVKFLVGRSPRMTIYTSFWCSACLAMLFSGRCQGKATWVHSVPLQKHVGIQTSDM